MDIIFIIKGLLIGVIVSAPVGPIAALVIQRSLNKGFWSGLATGFGAAFADVIYAIIAGFSISFIADFLFENQTYIRFIGGLFLIAIGIRLFFANPAKQIRKIRNQGNNYYKDFISSFIVTISNPITIIAFGYAFSEVNLFEQGNSFLPISILILAVVSGAILWWLLLAGIVTVFKENIRLRSLVWINKITGILLIIFALYLVISVFVPETSNLTDKF